MPVQFDLKKMGFIVGGKASLMYTNPSSTNAIRKCFHKGEKNILLPSSFHLYIGTQLMSNVFLSPMCLGIRAHT